MICCDNDNCKITWFHLKRLKMSEKSIPKGKWYCPDCQKNSKRKGKSTDHVSLLHSCNINNYVIQMVQQIHKHCLRHSTFLTIRSNRDFFITSFNDKINWNDPSQYIEYFSLTHPMTRSTWILTLAIFWCFYLFC